MDVEQLVAYAARHQSRSAQASSSGRRRPLRRRCPSDVRGPVDQAGWIANEKEFVSERFFDPRWTTNSSRSPGCRRMWTRCGPETRRTGGHSGARVVMTAVGSTGQRHHRVWGGTCRYGSARFRSVSQRGGGGSSPLSPISSELQNVKRLGRSRPFGILMITV